MGLFEKAFWLWAGCKVLKGGAHHKAKPKPDLSDPAYYANMPTPLVVFHLVIYVLMLIGIVYWFIRCG